MCRRENDVYISLGAIGVFDAPDIDIDAIASLLSAGWDESCSIQGVQYRSVTQEELRLLNASPTALGGGYLLMARIDVQNCTSPSVIVGYSHDCPVLRLDAHAEHVHLSLTSMGLTLALRGELHTAERLMVDMQRDAFIDSLTGVFNRAGWINRLAHIEAIIAGTNLDAAIVVLDLDFLKLVNDTNGHSAGDDLLRLTAQTISSVLRGIDSVGRLGGDEFGVVLQNATPPIAQALVQRLEAALAKVDVNISIGMALKSETGTLKKTFDLADERMYAEKRKKPIPARSRRLFTGATLDKSGRA